MAAPYKSAQKLRRDNCLSEITSNPTLKAAALANLGLTDVAGSNVAIASGKTFSVSNTLTLAGTDSTTMTFPSTSATIARTDAANTFTGVQTMTSPVLTTPSLGVATATSINGNILTTGSSTYTGTAGQTYTFPTTSATIARIDAANTFTGASTATSWNVVSPVITTGLTASGSAANTFAGSSGTFVTSTGLNTISGKLALKVIATPVAAAGAGGGVGGAAALGSANIVAISSDGATKGVKLLTGVAGDVVRIINTSGTAANLFAASGGTINGGVADVGCAIPASKGVIAVCTAADTWIVSDMTARAGAAA